MWQEKLQMTMFSQSERKKKCVRRKAVQSMVAVREDVTKEECERVVDVVFEHCYNDTEPFTTTT